MGEDELGSPGFTKSVRSLLEALSTLEREAAILLGRAGTGSRVNLATWLLETASAASRKASAGLDLAALLRRLGTIDPATWGKTLTSALGLADEAAIESLREEVREVVEQVARLRERELALAGGVSQLRARSARFEEALAGLARVQGKCVARLDAQVDRARALEHLAARRDDHITRLIRDTAGQRAELERLSRETAASRVEEQRPAPDAGQVIDEIRTRLGQIEAQSADLKKLQSGAAQRMIETLESLRDRLTKLESRAAEMSRESRAKAGRLDALARHVATVEDRLATAIGKNGDPLVPVPKDVDRPMTAAG
jgi:hypothetical protein